MKKILYCMLVVLCIVDLEKIKSMQNLKMQLKELLFK